MANSKHLAENEVVLGVGIVSALGAVHALKVCKMAANVGKNGCGKSTAKCAVAPFENLLLSAHVCSINAVAK